jgi:hypothetical protein
MVKNYRSGIVARACSRSPQQAEAGGLQFPGQTGIHSKTLSQKNKITTETTIDNTTAKQVGAK